MMINSDITGAPAEYGLSEAEQLQWIQEGFVRLGKIADDAQLRAMQDRIDAIMLGQAPNQNIWFQLDSSTGDYGSLKFTDGSWAGPSLNYRKIERLENDPVFFEYLSHPRFAAVTRDLISESVSIYRAMFMNKPAGGGTHLPYHQDAGTQWQLDRDPYVTIWTALDDATIENGCMQVIPGSHKLGLLSERGHTITPEQEAAHASDNASLYLEARAGEVLLLHNLLLHRSGVNSLNRPRRAFSVCYMDAATRDISGAGRKFPVVFRQGRRTKDEGRARGARRGDGETVR